VAEGGGLLNRCTVKSRTGGSNPPLSASLSFTPVKPMVLRGFAFRHSEGLYVKYTLNLTGSNCCVVRNSQEARVRSRTRYRSFRGFLSSAVRVQQIDALA